LVVVGGAFFGITASQSASAISPADARIAEYALIGIMYFSGSFLLQFFTGYRIVERH
jgi:hypothetical protein